MCLGSVESAMKLFINPLRSVVLSEVDEEELEMRLQDEIASCCPSSSGHSQPESHKNHRSKKDPSKKICRGNKNGNFCDDDELIYSIIR